MILLAQGVPFLAAGWVALARPARLDPRLVLGVALRQRLPLLSSDAFRYVWDGQVQRAGIGPFRFVPADPALALLRGGRSFPNIKRAGGPGAVPRGRAADRGGPGDRPR